MSSYLMYRAVIDEDKCFSSQYPIYRDHMPNKRISVCDSFQLNTALSQCISEKCFGKKIGLALSGGMDSAILLQYVPNNTIAYTLTCEGNNSNEWNKSEEFIKNCNRKIKHKEIRISWKDHIDCISKLMIHKGSPTHSIEVQIYKMAMAAEEDGCDLLIFGETADCIYGGHSMLLAKDWTPEEFIRRWTFVDPKNVLIDYRLPTHYFNDFIVNGIIDVPNFLDKFETTPSINFYQNACNVANMEAFFPYAHTKRAKPLDLNRVRKGENKYIIRSLFHYLYPSLSIPEKTPMPRPMDNWLCNWEGPRRSEFVPGCINSLKGDQKWQVWCLEKFLDLIED